MSRPLGVTTVTILAALQRRVRYGLDLSQSTGLVPATVYVTLRRLERRGHVVGRWEDPEIAADERRPRRRYYEVTEAGEQALAEALVHYEGLGFEMPTGLSVVGDAEG